MDFKFNAYKRHAALARYTGADPIVVIPDEYKGLPVTEIMDNAFAGNSKVEKVTLPTNLERIGDFAFAHCEKLRQVGCKSEMEISAAAEAAKKPNFIDKLYTKRSAFPAALRSVGTSAFFCTALVNLLFCSSESLTLGETAFSGCQKLDLVSISPCSELILRPKVFALSNIGAFCASDCRIDRLPAEAFLDCRKLSYVVVSTDTADDRCFAGCENLSSTSVKKQFTTVGTDAFLGCPCARPVSKKHTPPKRPSSKSSTDVLADMSPTTEKIDFQEATEIFLQRQELANTVNQIRQQKVTAQAPKAEVLVQDKDTAELKNAPVLCIARLSRSGKTARIPGRIKGIVFRKSGQYHIQISAPASLEGTSLLLSQENFCFPLTPLLRYLVSNDSALYFYGIQEGSTYKIWDLECCDDTDLGLRNRNLLHAALQRIRSHNPAAESGDTPMPPFTLTGSQADMFMEICSFTMPPWVREAYHRNLHAASNKDHAAHARTLLTNINWMPGALQVPTVPEARRLLDESFYGLAPVKQRVEEIIARIRHTGTLPKWGILLTGPAGTGKTTIAKAIAKLLHMGMIQLDMSSVGVEAETISGSSRIYNNARPGQLLQQMFELRSCRAVLLVNELDKAGGRNGHNAADVLLSILDKTGFYENFLEETLPTNNLLCVATCNDIDKISKPLRDRFLVIDVPAYQPQEKQMIFLDYVLPAMKKEACLKEEEFTVEQEAVELLISRYAVEPGVRDLEQYAERFVDHFCHMTESGTAFTAPHIYTAEDVRTMFGPAHAIVRNVAIGPGEANAAFYHGGEARFFVMEAAAVPGTGRFSVIGPMGENQKQFCQVAYWYARSTLGSNYDFSKLDITVFTSQQIPDSRHNHVGMACYAAICSRLLCRSLLLKEACFIGGCDLSGTLYFDEADLRPLCRAMKSHGVSLVYAPLGTRRLVDGLQNSDACVSVLEAPDAATLFSLAAANSTRKCG